MVKHKQFPAPVRIGKCAYWSKTAIQNWFRRTFDEQESWGERADIFVA